MVFLLLETYECRGRDMNPWAIKYHQKIILKIEI